MRSRKRPAPVPSLVYRIIAETETHSRRSIPLFRIVRGDEAGEAAHHHPRRGRIEMFRAPGGVCFARVFKVAGAILPGKSSHDKIPLDNEVDNGSKGQFF